MINTSSQTSLGFNRSLNHRAGRSEMAPRLIVLIIPITISAGVLSLWLSKPVACALSTAFWMLLSYWLPSRAEFTLRGWLLIVGACSAAAFLLTRLLGWF